MAECIYGRAEISFFPGTTATWNLDLQPKAEAVSAETVDGFKSKI